MFQSINIMNKVLDATMLRFNTLNNNIANAETPDFKRSDVAFEAQLAQALKTYGADQLDVTRLEETVYTDYGSYAMRLDGNNVDIDNEMSELAKTQLRYYTLVQRATSQLSRYKYILQNIK